MNRIESLIETIIDEYHADKRLSGTILISKDRSVIFEKAYGEASIQLGVPNRLDTKFHIASVTKMFIAAAALKLHGEGRINLHHHPGAGQDNPRLINKNRACGHTVVDGEYRNAENDKLADLAHVPGELYSTVKDLRIWCDALLNHEILPEDLSAKLFTPYASVDFDPGLMYGYGWFLGGDRRIVGGGTPGFRSEIFQSPEQKINVIMLWNNETVNSHELYWRIHGRLR